MRYFHVCLPVGPVEVSALKKMWLVFRRSVILHGLPDPHQVAAEDLFDVFFRIATLQQPGDQVWTTS